MDRLTDEYIPVFVGLTEADEVYAVIMYAKRGQSEFSSEAKIMFYVFDGDEIYNTPVSGVDVQTVTAKSYANLYNVMRDGFVAICENVATRGINVYEIRNSTVALGELVALQRAKKGIQGRYK